MKKEVNEEIKEVEKVNEEIKEVKEVNEGVKKVKEVNEGVKKEIKEVEKEADKERRKIKIKKREDMQDMRKMRKLWKMLLAAVLSGLLLITAAGCSSAESENREEAPKRSDRPSGKGGFGGMRGEGTAIDEIDFEQALSESSMDMEFSERDLDFSYDASDAFEIVLKDNKSSASDSSVKISQNTVTITEEGIYEISGTLSDGQLIIAAKDSDKVQLVLNGAVIHGEDSAAIYVKSADKVFLTQKEGSKNVLSGGSSYQDTDENTVDAVVFSKTDLTINGTGDLTVKAAYKHGIISKDTLAAADARITVEAVGQCLGGKDGVKIAGGTYILKTEGDGIKASGQEDSKLNNVFLNGGKYQIEAGDDAIHADGSLVIKGGTYTIEAGDDAAHAEIDTVIEEGTIHIAACCEGLEGRRVTIQGGTIEVNASDDGINAAYENDQDESAYIKVTGGKTVVCAKGDGFDSNGYILQEGGEVYISGPESNGNSSLDYNYDAKITGGTFAAAGSAGMAEGFGSSSTQCALLQNLDTQMSSKTEVKLTDENGTNLFSWTPDTAYDSVILSLPKMQKGKTFTLTAGTYSTEITLEEITTNSKKSAPAPK